MRTTLINKLVELANIDPDIYLIIGDYGYSVVETFKNNFPARFLNSGICEQNMIGIAAGLALTGKKVFVYSPVPFATMRCFEQIRIDLCYQNLPVRIVGIGAGFAFGPAATTHHAIEDLALMCSLPNMTVISPANSFDVQTLLPQVNKLSGPVYLRLGRGGPCMTYPCDVKISFGENVEIIPSNKNLLLVTGELFSLALEVVQKLHKLGIDCGLVNIHTIKPLNLGFIASKANSLNAIFTLEEHVALGGLGQQVSFFLCQNLHKKILFNSFTLPDTYFHEIGSRDYLLNKAGLNIENICASIIRSLDVQTQTSFHSQARI